MSKNAIIYAHYDTIDYYMVVADKLTSKGVDVYFLADDYEPWIKALKKNYKVLLFQELLYSDEVKQEVDLWLEQGKGADVRSIYFKGLNLWELIEYERNVQPKLQRELLINLYKRFASFIEAAYRLFYYIRPPYVFLWNGLTGPAKAFAAVAKEVGIITYFSERGYFPKTLVIDERGVNYRSILCTEKWNEILKDGITKEEIEKLETFLDEFHLSGSSVVKQSEMISKKELYAKIGISYDKKLLFNPAQIDTDTNIILFSPYYKRNEDVIRDLIKATMNYPEYYLVIKLHPEDVDRENEFSKILGDKGTILSDINLHALLQASDAIIVRNSSVGLEALTYYKPVIVLGNAIYSKKGFTFDITSRDELGTTIGKILETPFLSEGMKSTLQKFLHYILEHYLFFLEEDKNVKNGNGAIIKKILSNTQEMKFNIISGYVENNEKQIAGLLEHRPTDKDFSNQREWNLLAESNKIKNILIIQFGYRFKGIVKTLRAKFHGREIQVFEISGRNIIYRYLRQIFTSFKLLKDTKFIIKRYDMIIFLVNVIDPIPWKIKIFATFCKGMNKFLIDSQLRKRQLTYRGYKK